MWLYPLPAFVALIGWLYMIATQTATQQLQALFFLIAGLVCYLFWRKLSADASLTQH